MKTAEFLNGLDFGKHALLPLLVLHQVSMFLKCTLVMVLHLLTGWLITGILLRFQNNSKMVLAGVLNKSDIVMTTIT